MHKSSKYESFEFPSKLDAWGMSSYVRIRPLGIIAFMATLKAIWKPLFPPAAWSLFVALSALTSSSRGQKMVRCNILCSFFNVDDIVSQHNHNNQPTTTTTTTTTTTATTTSIHHRTKHPLWYLSSDSARRWKQNCVWLMIHYSLPWSQKCPGDKYVIMRRG